MNDSETTISQLKAMVASFCTDREWDVFHNPKDLAIGISTEAAELLEIFRFKDSAESSAILSDPKLGKDIRDELSDVLYFVMRFAQMNGIDLSSELSRKLAENAAKYPVEKCRGCNKKYNEYRGG